MTLGAMTVAAGVVADDGMGAVLAARDMAAKLRRAAGFDGRHRFQLPKAHMPGVGLAPGSPVAAEDVRNARRSAAELEAAISAALLRPIESYQRIRTVTDISDNCQRADVRTAEACAAVAKLREDLASAKEERDLDRQISELKSQARQLRERGAMKSADPQAELLARLSGGMLSPHDVGPGLSLLLAVTIELVSAIGPTVIFGFAEATERGERKWPDKAIGLVVDYLEKRVEPAANTDTLSESALYADYAAWCRASGRAAMSAAEFVTGFDQLRAENGLGKIRKRKGGYCGIKLAVST